MMLEVKEEEEGGRRGMGERKKGQKVGGRGQEKDMGRGGGDEEGEGTEEGDGEGAGEGKEGHETEQGNYGMWS